MFGKLTNLTPNEKCLLMTSSLQRAENQRLVWYQKYWDEFGRCGFPCNRIDRARRLVNANLYEISQDLIIKHENLLKTEAVREKKKTLPFDQLYKKDLYDRLKQTRESLCLEKKDEFELDEEERKNRMKQTKCDIRESIRNVKYRTGLIASSLERLELRNKRSTYVPRTEYHNFDSESSLIGWKCFEEVDKEGKDQIFHKNHEIKHFYQPNGVFPKNKTTL